MTVTNRTGLPSKIAARLRLPLVAAPMLRVSGVDLVTAVCRSGAIGAFEELDHWLVTIDHNAAKSGHQPAPHCPNLIVRQPRLQEDLACLVRHKVEMVITSAGSPAVAVGPLHDVGCLVFADIASLDAAEKAIKAGADGLILLSAGAGGQTGWANRFAFVRAVRAIFDGPIVLAGGVADGVALAAARLLGCDLAYTGIRFIAARESMASDAYRQMLVDQFRRALRNGSGGIDRRDRQRICSVGRQFGSSPKQQATANVMNWSAARQSTHVVLDITVTAEEAELQMIDQVKADAVARPRELSTPTFEWGRQSRRRAPWAAAAGTRICRNRRWRRRPQLYVPRDGPLGFTGR